MGQRPQVREMELIERYWFGCRFLLQLHYFSYFCLLSWWKMTIFKNVIFPHCTSQNHLTNKSLKSISSPFSDLIYCISPSFSWLQRGWTFCPFLEFVTKGPGSDLLHLLLPSHGMFLIQKSACLLPSPPLVFMQIPPYLHFPGREAEQRVFLWQWNYSIWFYESGYMSL